MFAFERLKVATVARGWRCAVMASVAHIKVSGAACHMNVGADVLDRPRPSAGMPWTERRETAAHVIVPTDEAFSPH